MTLTVDELAGCRPDLIEAGARGLTYDAWSIDGAVHALPQLHWSGVAAEAAAASLAAVQASLQQLGEAVSGCAAMLAHAATGLRPACAALHRAQSQAALAGLQLDCGGRVSARPVVFPTGPRGDGVLTRLQEAAETAAAVEALAVAALRAADDVDVTAAAGLRRLVSGLDQPRPASSAAGPRPATGWQLVLATATSWLRLVSGSPSARVPSIPSGAAPVDVAAWWAVLPAEAQDAVLAAQPDALGGLEGLPASARHRANVTVLRRELAAAEQTLARVAGPPQSRPTWREATAAVHRAAMLRTVQAELAADPRRTLTTLDLSDGGLAAVTVGDLDSATNVAVVVPGLGCDVTGDLHGLVADATTIEAAAGRLAPAASLATVAWIGYRTPDVASVASADRARAGARRLTSFVGGIDGARAVARIGPTAPDAMHVTLVGHSYGSLAVGLALRRGLAAGDVVFVGSPGVGVSSVSELGMTGEHVFVGETASDAVADLGWFGRDPSWPEFGASVLPTGARIVDGERLRAARWHSDYFGEGTSSVHAIAAIAVAEPAAR